MRWIRRVCLRLGTVVASISLLAGFVVAPAAASTAGPSQLFRSQPPRLSAAMVRRLSAGAPNRSIIIFKSRAAGAHAWASPVAAAQASILSELKQLHAPRISSFHIINAISAAITPAEARRLRANPSISAVVPDSFRPFAPIADQPAASPRVALDGSDGPLLDSPTGSQQVCPSNPAVPLIEPEARTVVNADAANQIATGRGVKVAILGDGIDVNNVSLIRPDGSHVMIDYKDFSGQGTDAPTDGRQSFLAAGTIAAQGTVEYDLSGFVNPAHPLPPGCNITIKGIAPGASLVVLKVAGSNGGAFDSQIVQAIQYAVTVDHVNVLNESIAGNPLPDTQDDPVALANQAAVAAGTTVVVNGGDAGPFNTIGAPATAPGVIAVGGTTTYQAYRQTTRAGANLVPGGWESNNISALSSSGITSFAPHTVDVVAPADLTWSICSNDTTEYQGCADIDHGSNPPGIFAASSTGSSAAATSATAALVIDAYENTHAGTPPSPAQVKQIIVSSATDLDAPADHQGAGMVNALKAVQLTRSIGTTSPQGNTLLVTPTALNATVNAGQKASFTVGVTNEGSSAQTVSPTVSGRPTTLTSDTGAVALTAASPSYIDGEGHTDSYTEHQFTVPPGADTLNGNITWNAQSSSGTVFETLFDPAGNMAAYSVLGTNRSGFGHVEVHNPAAGVWTALIFTVNTAPYVGAVQFSYSTQQFQSSGTVTPSSLTLAPGQSGSFNVAVTAGQAGDEALSLHLGTGGSDDGSLPISLRALAPLTTTGGSFAGTLTGGAATGAGGQTLTYQFKVPAKEPSLNVALNLTDNNYNLTGVLVDPHGQPMDAQSTAQFDATDTLQGYGNSMQFFRGTPDAGVWTLVLRDNGPGDGAHLVEPFTGAISFAAPSVTSSGIPNSSKTVLKAGQPATATITITNTGTTRKDYFADARLNNRASLQLLGSNATDVSLPLSGSSLPSWLVPPGTTGLTVTGQGTVPITMDVSWALGDPDVAAASPGNTVAASLAAAEVAPGTFVGMPAAYGPFSNTGTSGQASLTATANTYPFDSTVSSSSGDMWARSVDASAPYTPLSLAPGETGTITITITPSATSGAMTHGFIGVDTFNPATNSGDELTSIPYTYKVG